MNANDTALAVAHTSSGAEVLARKLRKAAVVSAFSTVPSEVFFDVFGAKREERRRPSLLGSAGTTWTQNTSVGAVINRTAGQRT